jgi:hypothetical protein
MARSAVSGLLVAALLGCSQPGTRVSHDTRVDFSRYRHIGVAPVTDPRGRGALIAEGVDAGLRRLGRGVSDGKALEAILRQNKPDHDFGWGLEALESVRTRTSAEALVFISLAPDWSAASVTLLDTELGEQVLSAVLRPGGKKAKAFADPQEVVQEALRVITALPR